MFNTSDLALRGTIQEIVKSYNEQTERIREAYATLADSAQKLTLALGKDTPYSGVSALPRNCHSDPLFVCEEVLTELKKNAWKTLLDRLGIRKILSESRNNELSSKLDNPKNLPDLTVENLYETFELLLSNANQFAQEAIKEVYDGLHPGRFGLEYKTNQRNAFEDIGPKVILAWKIERGYQQPFRVRYGSGEVFLNSLDKVFHSLDGAPFLQSGYKSPLVDAINTSHGIGETAYFKFKCYQNGNLHLEFKRADLLKEFNRAANDGTALKSGFKF